MNISGFETYIDIRKEIGLRIKRYRIALSKTQQNISDISGVSLGTIKALEKGEGCSLDNLIRIMKSLDLSMNFNNLIPSIEISPIDYFDLGKERERARVKRNNTKKVIWEEDR